MIGAAAVLLAARLAAAEEPPEIVVAAERPRGPPAGTVEVSTDEAAPADGLDDLLATVPGARVRRLGGRGAFAGVSLRGTGFRQSLVRLDGVPLNPDGVEAVDLSQWPLAGLARVRVTAGRAPATVGGAPIGGVVDLETRDGAPVLAATFAGGSFASARAAVVAGTPWDGPVPGDALVAADGFVTEGDFPYRDDGGTVYVLDDDQTLDRANDRRLQGAVLARVRLGDGSRRATLLASLVARREGLPGPVGVPQLGTALATRRALVSLGGEGTLGAGRLEGAAWWLGRAERLDDARDEIARLPEVQRSGWRTLGARLAGEGALTRWLALRGSADLRHETFARLEPSATRAARWGLGAALDLPVVFDTWEVVPGVGLRGLLATAPEAGATWAVLPGATVRVRPLPVLSLWTSGGAGFRPPDLTELYGDRGALVGSPDLRPERAWKAELGLRLEDKGEGPLSAALDLAVHAAWATDAIGWLQNTQRTLVAVNFGRTRTLGGDLGAGLAWEDRIGLRTSLSLLNAVQTTPDPTRQRRPVPFTAPARLWTRLWTRPGWGIEAGFDVDHTAPVPVDPQGVTRQPPRTLIGAHLAWTPPRSVWTVALDVDNLTDVRTGLVDRDPLGADDARVAAPITDFVGYPLPGRTLWVSLRLAPPLESS